MARGGDTPVAGECSLLLGGVGPLGTEVRLGLASSS